MRREGPVSPLSAPPPVSGAWGVGTGSPMKPPAGLHLQRFRPVQRGKFWVRIPSSSVEPLTGRPVDILVLSPGPLLKSDFMRVTSQHLTENSVCDLPFFEKKLCWMSLSRLGEVKVSSRHLL